LRWRGDQHGHHQEEQEQQANVIGKKTFCFHCQCSRDRQVGPMSLQ
jgi:redox-regulated HSP33 family molecular chaperone